MKKNLYTETIDPTLAQTVRMIPLAHERFATDWMGEPQGNTLTRLVARQEPGTQRWAIDRMTALRLGDDADDLRVSKETAILRDLCPFDALHYCHTHQTTDQELLGKIALPAPDAIADDTPHYRTTATASHQVFDINTGALCPVAGGDILVDGDFRATDFRVAKETRAIALTHHVSAVPAIFKDPLKNLPAINVVAGNPDNAIAARHLGEAVRKGDRALRTLVRQTIGCTFYSDTFNSNPVFLSLSPLLTPSNWWSLKSGFRDGRLRYGKIFDAANDLDTVALKLPDSLAVQKNLLRDFSSAVKFAACMETAADMTKLANSTDNEELSIGMLRSCGLRMIHKAAALSGEDREKLEHAFKTGALAAERHAFRSAASCHWMGYKTPDVVNHEQGDCLRTRLNAAITALGHQPIPYNKDFF